MTEVIVTGTLSGEQFFAEGRDTADYELIQQQMRRAGNWRLGLRRTVLGQLSTLGRDVRVFRPHSLDLGRRSRSIRGRGRLLENSFRTRKRPFERWKPRLTRKPVCDTNQMGPMVPLTIP